MANLLLRQSSTHSSSFFLNGQKLSLDLRVKSMFLAVSHGVNGPVILLNLRGRVETYAATSPAES